MHWLNPGSRVPAGGGCGELGDEDVVCSGLGRQGFPGNVAGDEGQDFPALAVYAERDGSTGEAGAVQVGEEGLDRGGERPGWPPDGVPDPHDARRDTLSDQGFPGRLVVVASCLRHWAPFLADLVSVLSGAAADLGGVSDPQPASIADGLACCAPDWPFYPRL
jgi:hypothetical protein